MRAAQLNRRLLPAKLNRGTRALSFALPVLAATEWSRHLIILPPIGPSCWGPGRLIHRDSRSVAPRGCLAPGSACETL